MDDLGGVCFIPIRGLFLNERRVLTRGIVGLMDFFIASVRDATCRLYMVSRMNVIFVRGEA